MSYNQKEQFSAIAEAIRGKDGTTDAIAAKDFAARIAAIPTGGKIYTTTVTVTSKNNGQRSYPFTVTGIGFTPTSVFLFDTDISMDSGDYYAFSALLFTGNHAYTHSLDTGPTIWDSDFYSSFSISFGDGTFSFKLSSSKSSYKMANGTYIVVAWQD